ncbi:Uncharacterized protein SCF082_LOCUS21000 [Durusdinium trenchii]|uniref:Uncharacterized protein n=1 Tax=Durusdinium trenchii TaxID=1381693 RepID=A0ABP0L6H8_9DINO
MVSLIAVALPLAMASLVAVLAMLVAVPVAGQLPGQPAQPPCRGGSLGTGNSRSAALQDAVEGIAGLMQRFEELQPQIAQLPPTELQEIATPAQKLHERFENMQKKLVANGNANANPELEEEAITFHRDLAVFVNGVAKRFGITGPRGLPGAPGAGSFAPVSLGSLPRKSQGAGVAGGTGPASPATEQRLQAAMQAIQSGMQRFEALHSKLPNLPPQVFNPLADQAQKLHEEFLRLQQKGMQLTSGQLMLEADAAPYADELESYVSRQLTFVGDAEYQVKQAAGSTSGLGGYQGMLGSRLPTGTTGPSVPPQPMPPLGSFGAAQPPQAAAPVRGQVTPDTDRRLSAVIDKVIRLMQEFQGMAPQLARVPQQVIAPLASMGTSLDTRFRDLQRRGTEIAGDSTRPMSEKDASQYLRDLEAFHLEQERYVEQAKQALKAAPQGQVGQSGQGGLGSARLEDLRGVGGPSGGCGGLPNIQTPPTGLGAATMGTPKPNGLGGFGGGLGGGFGGLGSGLGTAPKAPGIGLNAPTIAVNSFGTGLGSAAGASFGRRGDQYRSSQAFGLASLEEMGQATLNTAVLPQNSHVAVCGTGTCRESSS